MTQASPAASADTVSFDRARSAVVTGASSGIGRATALQLAQNGWRVFAVARREDRLTSLVEETSSESGVIIPLAADVTDAAAVESVRAEVERAGGADTLLNIAGGALGSDTIGEGSVEEWDWMFQVNVIGTLRVTQAFLPMLRASGQGTILNLTSTAGIVTYEGGGGYNAAKHGAHGLTGALRLEEAEHNIRVVEVLPGMVHTEEFSVKRMRGDQQAADNVYAGVDQPLTAEDVADVCVYSVSLPHHINLDQIVMRPVAQAAQHKVIRGSGA